MVDGLYEWNYVMSTVNEEAGCYTIPLGLLFVNLQLQKNCLIPSSKMKYAML